MPAAALKAARCARTMALMRDASAATGHWRLASSRRHPLVRCIALLLLGCLSGCGERSGSYFGGGNVPPLLVRAAPPRGAVGTPVEWTIPLSGGCGGPYTMEVLRGALPPGVTLDAGQSPGFRGTLTQAGEFRFEVRVVDTCTVLPTSLTIWITWEVDPAPTAP